MVGPVMRALDQVQLRITYYLYNHTWDEAKKIVLSFSGYHHFTYSYQLLRYNLNSSLINSPIKTSLTQEIPLWFNLNYTDLIVIHLNHLFPFIYYLLCLILPLFIYICSIIVYLTRLSQAWLYNPINRGCIDWEE